MASCVFTPNPDRPYFDAWLRRTGRQFAVSGRLTQTAAALSGMEGGSVEEWRLRLRGLLDGGEVPSLDLLVRIDGILAGPSRKSRKDDSQSLLF
jgi:hypothetical protein